MSDPVVRAGTTDGTTGWPVELNEEYEFLGELGRGGMAVVYRAKELALGREVAVKVVRPRFHADEEAVARLAREARTVAQLEHPNIVSLHAIKRLNNGLALVMQIVPGQTLKAALARGGLQVERAEAVLKDVARALAYAHRCGVVHRDVKPENIFLDEVTGRALLSDFGVARSISENSELTATGTAIGTPTYMSPEQIDGGSLDGRSDLYALGMVGWEILTGQRPWMGESLYSVIYRQKHDALPPLDALRPDIPPRLQYLLEGLMAKKPDHRWPSAARFLTLLTSTDKITGFKEWQSAAKKRRKAGSRGRSVEVRAVSPQSSTVQFRRGETPQGTIPSSLNELSATASGEFPPRQASPWGQSAISVSFDQPPPQNRWWTIGLGALAVVVVAALGIRQFTKVQAAPVTSDSARFADNAGVEVPVIARRDSAGIDSAAGVTTPAVDSSRVATLPPPVPPRTDSARTTTPAGTGVVTDPVSLPVVPTPTPDSAKPLVVEPTSPTVTFSADRGTIAAGSRHSCMLDGDGRALCWGSNDRGQLGDGSFGSRPTPAAVQGDFAFAFVSSGGSHSCGVSRDGDAYCWGANESGQLGDGTSTPRNAPVRVSGSASFRLVRAGRLHSCGLTRGGSVQCWGSNGRGQLGDGSHTGRANPVSVSLGSPAGALSVGSNHSCALTRAGEALCWGRNDGGQLGDGTTTDHLTPVAVASSERFVSIAAGSAHTCAVTTGGDVYCWGQNQYGQLGTGGAPTPTPQKADAPAAFSTVSTGDFHTCGRTQDGRGFCWGRNAYGQVGDGSTVDRAKPVAIRGLGALSALNASGAHTCGVAGGEAFCWGYNVDGQLGSGDQENASAPARVSGGTR